MNDEGNTVAILKGNAVGKLAGERAFLRYLSVMSALGYEGPSPFDPPREIQAIPEYRRKLTPAEMDKIDKARAKEERKRLRRIREGR